MADMRTKSGKRVIANRYIELSLIGDKSGKYRDMKQSIDLHRHRERMQKRKEAKALQEEYIKAFKGPWKETELPKDLKVTEPPNGLKVIQIGESNEI